MGYDGPGFVRLRRGKWGFQQGKFLLDGQVPDLLPRKFAVWGRRSRGWRCAFGIRRAKPRHRASIFEQRHHQFARVKALPPVESARDLLRLQGGKETLQMMDEKR